MKARPMLAALVTTATAIDIVGFASTTAAMVMTVAAR